MKPSTKMHAAMQEQIRHEMNSAMIYYAMEAHFTSLNLEGLAHFFKLQAEEEMAHARRFMAHLAERGVAYTIPALDEPKLKAKTVREVFAAALKHEQFISAKISSLMDLARAEKDYNVEVMLSWFVAEQMEEEASMESILGKLGLIGEHGPALLMLDAELGKRS